MQVIVLGMHRSGTSTVGRILNLMGCYFGTEQVSSGPAEDNPKGFWERKDVVQVNELILGMTGGSWWDVTPLDFNAIDKADRTDIQVQISQLILKLDAHRPWFIKDPRMAITLDFWLEALELPVFLYVYRSPVHVAKSLERRNAMPLEYGLALWEYYTKAVFQSLNKEGYRPIVVSYEDLLQAPFKVSQELYHHLSDAGVSGLTLPDKKAVESFVDPKLCHFDKAELEVLNEDQKTLHEHVLGQKFDEIKIDSDLLMFKTLTSLRTESWAGEIDSFRRKLTREELEKKCAILQKTNVDLQQEKNELKHQNADLKQSNSKLQEEKHELSFCLYRLVSSRIIQSLANTYRMAGQGDRGVALLLKDARLLLGKGRGGQTQISAGTGKLNMVGRVLRQAVSSPSYCMRLLHPRKIQAGLKLLAQGEEDFQQTYQHWQDIHFSDAGKGDFFNEAVKAKNQEFADVFVFPVIDWNFRMQRPQHLAMELGKKGHRVFYFSTVPLTDSRSGLFRIIDNPDENVFICQLSGLPGRADNIYHERMGDKVRDAYGISIRALMHDMGITSTISLIDHFYWKPLADIIPGTLIGYDCMDHHVGFHEDTSELPADEAELVREADFVLTTSAYLYENIGKIRETHLVRNGCEYSFFADVQTDKVIEFDNDTPVAGYVGAIAQWFDIEMVIAVANKLPHWKFVLVGSTVGCETEQARKVPNIVFTGEVKYSEVAGYVNDFDVCMIPFKLIELTKATNPVKVYEYLSAGKPVVSTALPEVELLSDKVFIANGAAEYTEKLVEAYKIKDDAELIAQWRTWAAGQDWSARVSQLEEVIKSVQPLISIVVLTYNHLDLTKACLDSIDLYTYYPNFEIIVVDNCSQDGTQDFLKEWETGSSNRRVILNEQNLGFAGGNNMGIKEARGEYIVLLNNDTYVSPGWLKNIQRTFIANGNLGMAGPVTNNIGNEAKINITYDSMEEMLFKAMQYTNKNARRLLFVNNVALFCAILPRRTVEQVGLLDEQFEMGFFEDDDYCRRVKEAGYEIAIVEDSFVHHELSASFDKLGSQKRKEIFEANRKRFEAKWGAWEPHTYR